MIIKKEFNINIMKKIIFWIFLSICVILAAIFVRIIFADPWNTDCMIEYVMSDEKKWYMYKIDNNMYHIDSKKFEWVQIIGITRWCMMIPYEKKFTFMAFSNTLYCWVVTIIS